MSRSRALVAVLDGADPMNMEYTCCSCRSFIACRLANSSLCSLISITNVSHLLDPQKGKVCYYCNLWLALVFML